MGCVHELDARISFEWLRRVFVYYSLKYLSLENVDVYIDS